MRRVLIIAATLVATLLLAALVIGRERAARRVPQLALPLLPSGVGLAGGGLELTYVAHPPAGGITRVTVILP